MAEISDAMILEWERLRALLVSTLQDKGIELADDATMQEAVVAVDDVADNDMILNIIGNEYTNFRLDRAPIISSNATSDAKYDLFNSYMSNCIGLFLPNTIQITNGISLKNSNLKYIYIPNLTTWYSNANILTTSKVENFVAPKLTTASNTYVNDIVTRIITPRLSTESSEPYVASNGYNVNRTLKLIDLTYTSNVFAGGRTTDRLNGLQTIILRDTNRMSPLGNVVALTSLVDVYVPSAMIDTYKSATNWSTIEDKIHTLEGSKYESENWYENESWYQDEMDYWEAIYPDFES